MSVLVGVLVLVLVVVFVGVKVGVLQAWMYLPTSVIAWSWLPTAHASFVEAAATASK